jgi:hypothetical protein
MKIESANDVPAGKRKFSVNVPDIESYTLSEPMHGMRRPNGTIEWVAGGDAFNSYRYEHLAAEPRDSYAWKAWQEHMTTLANKAQLDPQEYMDQHKLVTRHVTIVVTAPDVAK